MDTSALKSAVESLESRSDSFEAWLSFWITCVVVGLVVEVFVVIKDHLRSGRHIDWKLCVELLGPVLITIGVAGELGIHFKAGHNNTELRSVHNERIGLLDKEASAARRETESIKRDTIGFSLQLATAKKDVAEANALAKKYEAGIADAKARAAEAEKGAAQAKLMAEAEQHERMKLEAIVAPRSLSLDQQRLIAAAIREFSGHAITVSSYGLDGEGTALATQIILVLRSAGIAVRDDRASSIRSGGFEFGVHLRGPAGEFISSLGNALSTIGKLQLFVNAAVSPGGTSMHGGATISGNAAISGGGGMVSVPVPTTGPISIMVGIKPVPGLIAQ